MFTRKLLEQDEALRQAWQREFSKVYGQNTFPAASDSGLSLKPVYTPADMQDVPYGDVAVPGVYPYTRGIYPLHYQYQPWVNQPVHGFGLPEQTRQRMDLLAREGMTGYGGVRAYNLTFDTACKAGLDPDDPAAQGLVGYGGTSLSTLDDMDRLFNNLPLDRTSVVLNVSNMSIVGLAMYLAYAEKCGVAPDKLRGNTMNWLYYAAFSDFDSFLPQGAFEMCTELVKYCTHHMPRWNTTNLFGYIVEETGGNAVQEVAFILAASSALTRCCQEVGLHPDQFLPRFSFQMGQGNDLLEQVAKLRALRQAWARLNRERFGCQDPRSLQARIHVHTAGSSLTAQQPLNNVVRAALQTLGAVLGGANSIHTCAYDEALSLPTEEAATLALRTQQVIQHETNIPAVADPLGGSYYVEWLTQRLVREVFTLLDRIEGLGGFQGCWESGWFRHELERTAYETRHRTEKGERVVVGVNRHASGEAPPVPRFHTDADVEGIAAERVCRWRQSRDSGRAQRALEQLRAAAEHSHSGGWKGQDLLMVPLVEAARSGATLGEMASVLKQTFGWGCAY
ncbi:MAG: acyl-CoA mutase large subunit family protein [Chloroflexi bacterium]|nr:acyl-CoA mutase large subunit family protein [Chloroflexota bacterium]